MDSTLVIANKTHAFADDDSPSNDPQLNPANWRTNVKVPASNVATVPYSVAPGATQAIFSGAETTAIDNTTQFTLALSSLSSSRYRFTATAGTLPALRTDRALTLNTRPVTVTVNNNQTATFAASAASFSTVQAGDSLWIPGPSTGDPAGPFNSMNEGLWVVLSVAGDGSSVQATRPTNVAFQGWTEVQTPSANNQLIAFSAAGIQVGDKVKLSNGFSAPVLQTYAVAAVTPTWFEVVSTVTLPVAAVGTPGTTGIAFYTLAKRYVRILCDQECIPFVNGNATDCDRTTPWQSGVKAMMGEYSKTGLVYSLSVQNASQQTLNLVVISAE